jgi:hypothetical protein
MLPDTVNHRDIVARFVSTFVDKYNRYAVDTLRRFIRNSQHREVFESMIEDGELTLGYTIGVHRVMGAAVAEREPARDLETGELVEDERPILLFMRYRRSSWPCGSRACLRYSDQRDSYPSLRRARLAAQDVLERFDNIESVDIVRADGLSKDNDGEYVERATLTADGVTLHKITYSEEEE